MITPQSISLGVGLRKPHYDLFTQSPPASVSWVEVISENFMTWSNGLTPKSRATLEKVRSHLPVVLHGVSMSLGSADRLDTKYLQRLGELVQVIQPAWISDHLCWTGVRNENLHDLLPLPYTLLAAKHVAGKIQRAQDTLKSRLLIENVSTYVDYTHSEMKEWEFLNEVSRRSGCGILLDLNNVYVNSRNQGFDPVHYLQAIPAKSVGQIHLAGHTDNGDHCVDTHDHAVCDDVWKLYEWWVQHKGQFPTLIEWDAEIPEWPVLDRELSKARDIYDEGTSDSISLRA